MSKNKSFQKAAKLLGTEREGLLISTFGAQGDIENEEGHIIRCHMRKNADPVVTGDRVFWLPEKDGTATVVGHAKRSSLLFRPEHANKIKLIAANIDIIIIVTSPPPILSEDMIDRYLVAAETVNIRPIILLNKMDLLDSSNRTAVEAQLKSYETMGYDVIYSSTFTSDGLNRLTEFLHHKTCVLVGQSGVGKSSIIAELTHEQNIKIGDVSVANSLGKHTTTTTRLYHLPTGGNLIDSPGVREFALWHVDPKELMAGFIDFKPYISQCKFRDCQHVKEPQCAVQAAVANQQIDSRRFASYQKMLSELQRNKPVW